MDPDQIPHSDLGLHCLPRSQKRDARLIWVNVNSIDSDQRPVRRTQVKFIVNDKSACSREKRAYHIGV